MSASLCVRARKRLSENFALDVNICAAPGVIILFGASGAGKTTLLRCIAGLLSPDEGRITAGDKVLFDCAQQIDLPLRRRGVGYVFQNLALFPNLSVEENVGYGLAKLGRKQRAARVGHILEPFGIAHLAARRPREISGGEQRRVALARSLVTAPDVLLLDEPMSGLDSPVRSKIMEDLRAWNGARGIPILYVTHAHEEVFALGERAIVLENGRVRAEGTPHQVLEAPPQEPLAQLGGFENIFEATVVARRESLGTMRCRLEHSAVELEVPLARMQHGDKLRVALRAGDILLATQRPEGLSARNVLMGRLISLVQQGVTVVAQVDAGIRMEAHLTLSARDSLGLQAGHPVWLVIKTYACRLALPER